MINLLSAFRKEDQPIWFNKEFHLDLIWWLLSLFKLQTPLGMVPVLPFSSIGSTAWFSGVIWHGWHSWLGGYLPGCMICRRLVLHTNVNVTGLQRALPLGGLAGPLGVPSGPPDKLTSALTLVHSSLGHSFSFTATHIAPCSWYFVLFSFLEVSSPGTSCSLRGNTNPCRPHGGASGSVTQKYQSNLTNGLALLTRYMYVYSFCIQDGSVLPASEQTLMCFCSAVIDHIHHTSTCIKVYMFGICSLHT